MIGVGTDLCLMGDYHTHSQYSHGKGDLLANVRAAVDQGLQELAVTDHGPRSYSLIPLGIKRPEVLLEIKQRLAKIQAAFPGIHLLCGVEANIISHEGELDVPDAIMQELDLAAAGLHLLIIPPDIKTAWHLIAANKLVYPFFSCQREQIRRWNTEAVVNAVRRHPLDFVTHPGYSLDIDTYSLAEACAEEGVWLEINARHGRLTRGFVRAAGSTGVRFVINSDAHSPDAVGELAAGVQLSRELGLSPERIINYQGFSLSRERSGR